MVPPWHYGACSTHMLSDEMGLHFSRLLHSIGRKSGFWCGQIRASAGRRVFNVSNINTERFIYEGWGISVDYSSRAAEFRASMFILPAGGEGATPASLLGLDWRVLTRGALMEDFIQKALWIMWMENHKHWSGRKDLYYGNNKLKIRLYIRRVSLWSENLDRIHATFEPSYNSDIHSLIGQLFLSCCQCMFLSFSVKLTIHLPLHWAVWRRQLVVVYMIN